MKNSDFYNNALSLHAGNNPSKRSVNNDYGEILFLFCFPLVYYTVRAQAHLIEYVIFNGGNIKVNVWGVCIKFSTWSN